MTQLLFMVSGTCAAVVALFFVRFWHETRDRFFLMFGGAFLTLSAHWSILAILHTSTSVEQHEYAVHNYVLRLLGFVLIAAAIIDKNRR